MFRASQRTSEPANSVPIQMFGVKAGRWQPHPANVRAAIAAHPRIQQARGALFVTIEAPDAPEIPATLHDELISAITESYYGLTGSITRGLREALLAGNALLYEHNLRADSEHRLLAGIHCVVLRDEDVYIGQLGPSLACLVQGPKLTRYPTDSIWFHSQEPSTFDLNREPMAGLRQDAEPDLYHTSLGFGDLLIMATTSLAREFSADQVTLSLAAAQGHSVQQWITGLAEGAAISGVVLGWAGQNSSTVADPQPVQKAPVLPPAAQTTRPESPPASRPNPAADDAPPFALDTPPAQTAPALRATTGPTQPMAPLAREMTSLPEPSLPGQPVSPVEDNDSEDDEEWDDAWDADQDTSAQAPAPARPRVDFGELRDSISDGAARVRRGTQDLLLGVLPNRLPERPLVSREVDRGISLSGRALVVVALALPLVMLFFVIMTRIQYDKFQRDQFSTIKALAQERYDIAMRTEDTNLKRQELYSALEKVQEGQALQQDDDTLNALERTILHRLDGVDTVKRVMHFWRLYDLAEDALLPTDSARIIIHGIDVYLLNRGSDRVYKFLLNDVGDALQSANANTLLIERGQAYDGIQLGDLVDVAWLARGGDRTLDTFVALERAGSLVAYDPQQGIDVMPVADSDRWLKPQAIGGYFGNLYVLDPLLGYILKYTPTDNAYTSSPTYYINPQLNLDLTGAIDMTIDGNVYVLFADGKILKFFNGEPLPFSMLGLPTPMRNPTTIFVSGEQETEAEGFVYVADTGNERIVQFTKSGQFVQQLRDKPGESHMNRLQGLYVDQATGRMFVLNDNTLWLTNFDAIE